MEPSASARKPSRPRLDRAPLAPAAAALAVGIVTGRFAPLPVGFWAVIAAAGMVLTVATVARSHLKPLAAAGVLAAIFSSGAAATQLAWRSVADDHIVTYTSDARAMATVQGQIITWPVTYADPPDAMRGYQRPPRTSFVLRATRILCGGNYRDVSGLVNVTVEEPAKALVAGARVKLIGWIGRYRRPDNPGQYDLALARRKARTLLWMTVPSADGAIPLSQVNQPWYARMFWRVRAAARAHLAAYGEKPGNVLGALIVGQRHPDLSELNRTMARAGIAHFMSISGLHLGIFLGFVYLLCRLLMLTGRRSAAVVLATLICYVLLAEPRPALLRSAIMAAAICLSTMLNRRYFLLNALSAAAIVLLVLDPLRLFQAGFQLSFAIVAGLILLHRPMRSLLFGRYLRRRGLTVFRDRYGARRWAFRRAGNWLIDLVSLSANAFIVAAPLVAYHFGIFSPFAPLLSLLLLPLLVAVLVPGYLSMALAWPMPNLAYWIGLAGAKAAAALQMVVEGLGKLPFLNLELRPVTPLWVLLCYATIASLALRRRFRVGGVIAAAAVLALVAATIYTQRPATATGQAKLHVLAVGAGQCAVMHAPGGKTYIFDAGTQSGYDIYHGILKPFLHNRRLGAPTGVFISHANTDHFNALGPLLAGNSAGRVYLNDYFGREEAPNAAVWRFMDQLHEAGVSPVRLHAGRTIRLDDRVKVDVLWPPAQTRGDLSVNDTSLVLRITCDRKRLLLSGDLDQTGQRELLAEPEQLKCDVLMLPHHGGWETTLPEFVRATGAEVILASCARRPGPPADYNETARKFYSQLRSGHRYYSTARNGWICVSFDKHGTDVRTMR